MYSANFLLWHLGGGGGVQSNLSWQTRTRNQIGDIFSHVMRNVFYRVCILCVFIKYLGNEDLSLGMFMEWQVLKCMIGVVDRHSLFLWPLSFLIHTFLWSVKIRLRGMGKLKNGFCLPDSSISLPPIRPACGSFTLFSLHFFLSFLSSFL